MKFYLWTCEDRNRNNPIMAAPFDGDICVSGEWLTILNDDKKHSVPLKDVVLIDFDVRDYKDEKG